MLSVRNVASCASIAFFIICFSIKINAQNEIKPNQKLFVRYSNDYISNLLKNSPDMISYLNYSLDNSCYFISENTDKFQNCPELKLFDNLSKTIIESSVNFIDKASFNILNYDLKLSYTQRTSYKIGNSNEIVIFYSLKEMADRYNSFKQSVK